MHPARKAEIDRLASLADAGARQAAEAFAQMVGQPIRIEAPMVFEGDSGRGAAGCSEHGGDGSIGVFFEFEGCLEALVGILFPESAGEALVRRIVGIDAGELAPPVIESALMEVGNILASHVASAIADNMGSRLLPSIPSLAMENAEATLRTFIEDAAGSDALRIESAFSEEHGVVHGRLILVPTQVAHWAPVTGSTETADV